jgi:uncharacterized protein with von Willebrand factor type A (vWA) domain
VDSHNLVYALDVSQSMQGEGIRRLQEELTRSLMGLTAAHRINLIFFNHRIRMWRKTLTPMEEGKVNHRESALLRARYLYAEGGTDLYGALKTAMRDEEVDSVILLSDGDPTVGEITSKRKILEQVGRMNRTLQITIHTVSVGEADPEFLRDLAVMTGGTFTAF